MLMVATSFRSFSTKAWSMSLYHRFDFESVGDLRGKTVVISGASRGLGLAIGLRCAQDGANVAILAKTD
jgi:citronellol/citronellal dehydrogenase